jgi:hypothetical protein
MALNRRAQAARQQLRPEIACRIASLVSFVLAVWTD